MIRPNRIGSTNMAEASARLASASIQPRRASPPEQFQHAEVETEEFHVADIGTVVALRSGLPMHSNPMSHARNVATWYPEQTVFARTQRLCKV